MIGVVASVADSVTGIVLSGPLLVAILIAMVAGAVSFFSPCCLPLVPGYLSYVAGQSGADARSERSTPTVPGLEDARLAVPAMGTNGSGLQPVDSDIRGGPGPVRMQSRLSLTAGGPPRSRAVLGAALFVLGFAAIFTAYGALFGSLGSILLEYQDLLVRVLGALTIVMGLAFTGALRRIPVFSRTLRIAYRPQAGLAGAPVIGALFGLGWTPCIGPTLAAVLALATSTADAGRGALLSFAYSAGLGIPFILAALSVQKTMRSFGWARRHTRAIMRTGGAMLVILGVLQLTGVWTAMISRLQGLIAGWQVPL